MSRKHLKHLIMVVIVTALVTAPTTASACNAAGKDIHVGQLTAVEKSAKTFTIFDVETASPITFIADATLIKSLENVRGIVQVKYDHVGKALKAIEVRY
ncbi:MAG: hypothetical protein ACE5LB_09990 [Acidiferrobacterales bacterium]